MLRPVSDELLEDWAAQISSINVPRNALVSQDTYLDHIQT